VKTNNDTFLLFIFNLYLFHHFVHLINSLIKIQSFNHKIGKEFGIDFRGTKFELPQIVSLRGSQSRNKVDDEPADDDS
jgi:hypothetical protein